MKESSVLKRQTEYHNNITGWKPGAAERLAQLAREFGFKAEIKSHRFKAMTTAVPSLVITPTEQGISTTPLYDKLAQEFPAYWESEVISSEQK